MIQNSIIIQINQPWMSQQTYKPLRLCLQCCENCFLHPEQHHNESQYIFNISQLQENVERIWHSSPVNIVKNKKISYCRDEVSSRKIRMTKFKTKCQKINKYQFNRVLTQRNAQDNCNNSVSKCQARINSFEVTYFNILVFSKLAFGKFCCHRELADIILELTTRSEFEIQKLSFKLQKNDLYSTLKAKRQNMKMGLKYIKQQIDSILQKKPIKCPNLNLPNFPQKSHCQNLITQKQLQSDQSRINLPSFNGNQQVSQQSMVTNGAIGSCDVGRSSIVSSKYASSDPKRMSKLSMFDSKTGSVNSKLLKMSAMGLQNYEIKKQLELQKRTQKYCYLSKEEDIDIDNQEQQEEFQILEVSDEELYEENNVKYTQEELIKLRIEQGLNSKLFALIPQPTSTARKYSSDLKKITQMLQLDLQQQQGKTIRQSRFFTKNITNILQKQKRESQKQQRNQQIEQKQNQNSTPNSSSYSNSRYSDAGPLLFDIDEKDLLSRRDLWKQINAEIQDERQSMAEAKHRERCYGIIRTSEEDKSKSLMNIDDVETGVGVGVERDRVIGDVLIKMTSINERILQEENILQEQKVNIQQQSVEQTPKDTIKSISPKKSQHFSPLAVPSVSPIRTPVEAPKKPPPITNFVQDFGHPCIKSTKIHKNHIQLFLDTHFLACLAPLLPIINYIHNKSPSHFSYLLHNPNPKEIFLSNFISKNKVTVYNIHSGLFETVLFDIEMSTPYCGKTEHWVLLICQAIKWVLGDCVQKINFDEVFRVLTGAPLVKIAGVNLRAVKRVVYEGWVNNGHQGQKNGYVLGIKDMENNKQFEQFDFCELLSFQKDKDFLKSIVTFKHPQPQKQCQNSQNHLYFSKTYEQFVLGYQNLLYLLYSPSYCHNQIQQQHLILAHQISQQSNQQNESIENNWYVCVQIKDKQCNIFVEFCQFQKLLKFNTITVSKAAQRTLGNGVDSEEFTEYGQPIGELRKKGNFFFELTLDKGLYMLKIARSFQPQQKNSIHLYSSQQIQIVYNKIRP